MARKFVEEQTEFDQVLTNLQSIVPKVQIARKNEKDIVNMERYTLTMK